MSNLVIVAIPAEDDPVWKISSEKVPHMTILFLGENSNHPNLGMMLEFLSHAANTSLTRFGLDVDRRGTLGMDDADVLFFLDSWELPRLRDFRAQLLRENNIRSAYDAAPQREGEWIPHLTLGYPGAPAHEDDRDYPGINWVNFDRVAMWTQDYDGPEFVLKRDNYYAEAVMPMGIGMSTVKVGEEFLSHYGVKGMKWGVRREAMRSRTAEKSATSEAKRRENRPSAEARVHDTIGNSGFNKTKISAVGGEDHPASEDALRVAGKQQILRKSGVHALSNKDLQDMVSRMNLEQQLKQLEGKRPQSLGKKATDAILKEASKDPVKTFETGKAVIDAGVKLNTIRKSRR